MNSIIYKSDVQEECLSANNIGSGNCSVNNINQALNNADETIRMLIAAQEEVDTANQEVASMLQTGIEVGNSTSSQLVLNSEFNNEIGSISLENGGASSQLTIAQAEELIADTHEWANHEKDDELFQAIVATTFNYYQLRGDMANCLNELFERTFEAVNVGFDEENGEIWKTSTGHLGFKTREEKLEYSKLIVARHIYQYLCVDTKEYNFEYNELWNIDVPDELSHIPDYL